MISHDEKWLRGISRAIDTSSKAEMEMVDMLIPMLEKDLASSSIKGAGLSAIQIGHPVRLCIIRAQNCNVNLINPVITSREEPILFTGEGCLSFPGIYKNTQRFREVTVEYNNILGDKQTALFEGFEAVVAQHEIDHMDGIIFLDRIQKPIVNGEKIGRNDPCPFCAEHGKAVKFKKCKEHYVG